MAKAWPAKLVGDPRRVIRVSIHPSIPTTPEPRDQPWWGSGLGAGHQSKVGRAGLAGHPSGPDASEASDENVVLFWIGFHRQDETYLRIGFAELPVREASGTTPSRAWRTTLAGLARIREAKVDLAGKTDEFWRGSGRGDLSGA